ncbi:polysaccharide biosynthesis tyrosine autokinase [Enterovibrio sp. ZSDZ35]|uniref:Polysaccharide biosynthesis tyrosine autokinase n=1 Tax=Enterovibrio qingdaonensis TaxID=2899818 RepID=A0ABT5QN97_9GAMM|nr:polysaccharide biosynthesis tyrosine autokinase [Enterovibrio sp. ZSDZ35]MDD1782458.1 polysaccharide biosynthesis tyrosine autokinase [Enterovibrio sp. ZSDZ35]
MTVSHTSSSSTSASDEIDLGKLFGILIDARWMILSITALFAVLGVAFAMLSTPIYKADALLQVEKKSSGMPALGDMGEMFSGESSSNTEIEIIKSRMVLGETVDKFNLTTVVSPQYIPVVGKGIARLTGEEMSAAVSRFTMPNYLVGESLTLTVLNENATEYELTDQNGKVLLKGTVGELNSENGIEINVQALHANVGDELTIAKRSRLDAIQWLQLNLGVSERGKQSGVLQLSMEGENKALIEALLNDIATNYFLQNVERNAAEAEKSLVFLDKSLPDIQIKLTEAEDRLNAFRQANESVDLSLEAKATLDVMVKLEEQLNQLTFKESEISQRYTTEHPVYTALLDKRQILLGERERLSKQTQKLPKTQREILRLTRDVEVNQQIYVQLLNKVQELRIVKASTVGNVRILDKAASYTHPVKPKKPLIAVLATLLGGMLGVAIALLKAAFHRGVENPDEIEAIGLPVYASLPLSDLQIQIEKKTKKARNLSAKEALLAEANPADLSIEALRSLRTSLHFAMMEAKNNILMISGPSPGIGKSFVSSNLAAVIAKTGQKVLLVDADMRKGYMQKHFGLKWENGLSDMLSGQAGREDVLKSSGVENLDVITRGKIPPNPAELLMHKRFNEFAEWASQNYDLVIIDTPPVLAVTDPAIIGTHAGTTLMVGRFGKNPVKEIEVANERFAKAGIEVKGFILNAVERKASNAYGGNYGYYNYSYK